MVDTPWHNNFLPMIPFEKKKLEKCVPPKGAKLNLHICENDVTSTDVTPKIIFPKKQKKTKNNPSAKQS